MAKSKSAIATFIESEAVAFTFTKVYSNPNIDDAIRGSYHFHCMFQRRHETFTVFFTMGPGCAKRVPGGVVCKPTAEEVLDCLASDAAGYENARSFEEWCGEYGYDPDSRKAKRTWKSVKAQSKGLKRLLGNDPYQRLLWETERL